MQTIHNRNTIVIHLTKSVIKNYWHCFNVSPKTLKYCLRNFCCSIQGLITQTCGFWCQGHMRMSPVSRPTIQSSVYKIASQSTSCGSNHIRSHSSYTKLLFQLSFTLAQFIYICSSNEAQNIKQMIFFKCFHSQSERL